MKTADIEIRVPAAIAALPLTIAEKIVLAHIAKFPGSSNTRLAELIGGTVRGAESLVRRLRREGYIEPTGRGRARRHHLTFHMEHHVMCGNKRTIASNEESHIPCGNQPSDESRVLAEGDLAVVKKETPLLEDYDWTLRRIDKMLHEGGVFPEEITSELGSGVFKTSFASLAPQHGDHGRKN